MQKRRKCLSTFDYLSRCTLETKAERRNGWLCHNKEKSIYREAKTPRNREKRKRNQRLSTMSRARFVFLLSSIVGLHFICMNFSCLNVARLNNEHLQCRTLSSCLCALELPPLKAATPSFSFACLLIFHGDRSFRLLFVCAQCRNMKD
ncbi:uncharacterized protein TNCV_775791 [Trichonephila clavipes]|nr:uncharacterized protein TNCV_775791 [Trichonephila clavipes]